MLPTYPANLLPRPFADNGTFQVIPDSKAAEGRASFKEGFPTETQLPLANGGVAPSRPDFNGILHMLSAMAFWQQSGGQWVYGASLDYNTPAVVFHNGLLWWCKAANGPGTTSPGTVEPGTNTEYWIDFLSFLAGAQGGASVGNPVGTIIMWPTAVPPTGYLACDGAEFSTVTNPNLFAVLGASRTPDMRGLFVRGYDPTGEVDPSGTTRGILTKQNHAVHDTLKGSYVDSSAWAANPTGVYGMSGGTSIGFNYWLGGAAGGGFRLYGTNTWDAARVTNVAPETRSTNINVLYCIKHD